jgi:hypothetical protein
MEVIFSLLRFLLSRFSICVIGKIGQGASGGIPPCHDNRFYKSIDLYLVWGVYLFLIDDGGKPIFLLTILGIGVINGTYLVARHIHICRGK